MIEWFVTVKMLVANPVVDESSNFGLGRPAARGDGKEKEE